MKALRLLAAAGTASVALVLLGAWANGSGANVPLPAYRSLPAGAAAAALGLLLAAAGLFGRLTAGVGFPSGPWPPAPRVSAGVYRVLPHPISAGIVFLCLGASLLLGSPGGLWLVTPTVMLACIALSLGRGSAPLEHSPVSPSFLHLPADEDAAPDWSDRWSVGVLVLLAWLAFYEAIMALGIPADARSLATPWESRWPVLEWTEVLYIGTYPFVMLVPFVLPTRRLLRLFTRQAWVAMGINLPLFLLLPFIAPPRPFTPQGWLGELLEWERRYDSASNAFPSFHVTWALLAGLAYSKAWPRLRPLWWALALGIAASTITTGMHTLADVAAAVLVVFAVTRIDAIRAGLRAAAERLAATWRRYRLGPVVVHHHGLYGGFAAFIGVGVFMALLAGRPVIPPRGASDAWLAIAVASIAAPWSWAAFRLRGLVRGKGEGALHPSLFQFLLWDLIVGLFLLRLWSLDAAPSLVAGVFLLLAGCGRFVEGWGDRLTQGSAVLAFLAGAALTMVPVHAPFPYPVLGWEVPAAALAAALAATGLFGVEWRPGTGEAAPR